MKHPYFHKAVMHAYDQLVPTGEMPNYFIYFTLDPAEIDVNIHPTKTEIKFENEQSIWQILVAAIRESLAKSNAIPTIDFDMSDSIEIPVYNPSADRPPVSMPQFHVNTEYNPFKDTSTYKREEFDWTKLYDNFEEGRASVQTETNKNDNLFKDVSGTYTQYKNRYILTALKSGLALIDQHRAHIRILYDQYITNLHQRKGTSQQMLFPEIVNFTAAESTMLPTVLDELRYIGFDLTDLGNDTYSINGIPAGTENLDAATLVKDAVNHVIESGCKANDEICEAIALSLAKAAAIRPGKVLSTEEMNHLIATLFSSPSPTYTPDGKLILSLLTDDELEKRFK